MNSAETNDAHVRGLTIPLALRLRLYALGLCLVFASVPFVHLYLDVALSWRELIIHAVDISLSAALAIAAGELLIGLWQRRADWRVQSAPGVLFVCGVGLLVLVAAPLLGGHDLLPYTDEIRQKHLDSGYTDLSLRLVPVTALIVFLLFQAARLGALARELRELRDVNEALGARQRREPPRPDSGSRLTLCCDGGEVAVDPAAIVRVQAQENYCEFVLTGERRKLPLLVRMTLAEAREKLAGEPFVQTHRSHLANLRFVEELLRDGRNSALALDGGHRVPIARSRSAEVRARVREHLRVG